MAAPGSSSQGRAAAPAGCMAAAGPQVGARIFNRHTGGGAAVEQAAGRCAWRSRRQRWARSNCSGTPTAGWLTAHTGHAPALRARNRRRRGCGRLLPRRRRRRRAGGRLRRRRRGRRGRRRRVAAAGHLRCDPFEARRDLREGRPPRGVGRPARLAQRRKGARGCRREARAQAGPEHAVGDGLAAQACHGLPRGRAGGRARGTSAEGGVHVWEGRRVPGCKAGFPGTAPCVLEHGACLRASPRGAAGAGRPTGPARQCRGPQRAGAARSRLRRLALATSAAAGWVGWTPSTLGSPWYARLLVYSSYAMMPGGRWEGQGNGRYI
jgi:hypothetical protein